MKTNRTNRILYTFMTDRERNTFQYKDTDIVIEKDNESVSGISFLIKDDTHLVECYYCFAYLDQAKQFIDKRIKLCK